MDSDSRELNSIKRERFHHPKFDNTEVSTESARNYSRQFLACDLNYVELIKHAARRPRVDSCPTPRTSKEDCFYARTSHERARRVREPVTCIRGPFRLPYRRLSTLRCP
ncbi:hypothetical protein EVAR_24013_1 [Eumeta japonica]|uniref:Uncharacterized protein n=1 Tax=Eumeta variegata TaxID=151549 RepID=A0A4C1W9P5_EUMVA|nr:hypothetical protein EVAR_24013_1 [Eumeta japonica]